MRSIQPSGKGRTDKGAIMMSMALSSEKSREQMGLEMLLYHLHKVRDSWMFISQSAVGVAYKDTLVWKIAQALPGKYEVAVRATIRRRLETVTDNLCSVESLRSETLLEKLSFEIHSMEMLSHEMCFQARRDTYRRAGLI